MQCSGVRTPLRKAILNTGADFLKAGDEGDVPCDVMIRHMMLYNWVSFCQVSESSTYKLKM